MSLIPYLCGNVRIRLNLYISTAENITSLKFSSTAGTRGISILDCCAARQDYGNRDVIFSAVEMHEISHDHTLLTTDADFRPNHCVPEHNTGAIWKTSGVSFKYLGIYSTNI